MLQIKLTQNEKQYTFRKVYIINAIYISDILKQEFLTR